MPSTVLVDLTPLDTPTRLRGIGRYLRMLASGIAAIPPSALRDVRLLALTHLDLLGNFSITDDFSAAVRAVRRTHPSQADRYRWAYARRLALWSAARKTGAACVHLGDPNATPLALPLARCRRVVTCHDLIPLQFPHLYLGIRDGFGPIGARLIRRRYRSADHVIAISDATRDELIRLVGLPPARVSRVYNGLDLEAWSPVVRDDDHERLARMGLTRGTYALYVGDTDWRKNADGMLAAVAAARRKLHDLRLVFVGKLEPHKTERIEADARRLGIPAAIRFLGFVLDEDLRALYRHALAHLFISRAEGFGYTVVEAMASGCPVITTRCGSLAEVAGTCAELVDPDRPEDAAKALVRLASESTHRAGLIDLGLRWARAFSCEAQARGTVDVLRKVL